MNLANATEGAMKQTSFYTFAQQNIKKNGFKSLYNGLSAGLLRQLFYATSIFGLFEVFRDELAKYREIDFSSRFICGVASGGDVIHECSVVICLLNYFLHSFQFFRLCSNDNMSC